MSEDQFLESLHMNTVTDNNGNKHLMSVPIVFPVSSVQKTRLETFDKVAFIHESQTIAILEEPEFYENRREEISARTFGVMSSQHEGAQKILVQGEFLITGSSMRFFRNLDFNDGMD